MEFISERFAIIPEAQALVDFRPSREVFTNGDNKTSFSSNNKEIIPWGGDNLLPNNILKKACQNDVVNANILFNIQSAYGNGIVPLMRTSSNGVVGYEECTDSRVLEFFANNDISNYFLEQITDLVHFNSTFPELILNKAGTEIVRLNSLEALHSRWGKATKNKGITEHFYANWEDSPDDAVVTKVLETKHTIAMLESYIAKKERRFVLRIAMPSPGQSYYPSPYWWSIFKSGWYDISKNIPEFKKVIMQNNMSLRYIVYISDGYWEQLARIENINVDDAKAYKLMMETASKRIVDFLSDKMAKGGTLISTVKYQPSGNSVIEDKYITIESIKSGLKDGEFLDDTEQANNIISYAQGVHPNLNGATPGKTSGSMGGTDKRELMMIKQATMKPYRDQLLKVFEIIKRFNKWPDNVVFKVSEYQFPTLDISKSGKTENIR